MRGDDLRAVHPAHGLPRPPAEVLGARRSLSCLLSLPAGPVIGESGRVDSQQWDERYSGAEFEWSMHANQFVAAELAEPAARPGP